MKCFRFLVTRLGSGREHAREHKTGIRQFRFVENEENIIIKDARIIIWYLPIAH